MRHRLLELGEKGDEGIGVSADQLLGLLAILEEHEGGHSADAELLAQLGQLVDVNLGEEDVLELLVIRVTAG